MTETRNNRQRRIRIGIDVGGTFTHAVAVETAGFSLLAQVKVPTTHTATEGVARGIIDSLHLLLEEGHIDPDDILLIAHSTTQATNALLEGDVAPVGIIGMGKGIEKSKAKTETKVGDIELAPGRFLKTFHRFLDTTNGISKPEIQKAIEELKSEGAQVFVASEAFSVEDPTNENLVVETCIEQNLPAANTHEISQLYGLRIRTRTAVINASMLPRMMETADMTEQSVRRAGINAPLMIMRSDGGIMDVGEMRRRPILTMLSGPAAGVAAALMYARITDGIFLEVGGTSTDISAIKNGKSLVKTATVGGHRLYLRTLDVRTVGIAGGSIPRLRNNKIADVGPRSAHIANLGYASFTNIPRGAKPSLELIQPRKDDPDDYIKLSCGGKSFTLTPTCAANILGLAPENDPAKGNPDTLRESFALLAEHLGATPRDAARQILDKSFPRAANVVEDLIEDYKLDRNLLTLSGGGGGALAIVPCTAEKMGLPFEIAPNAPVISAIGAALAMVRDMIERSVVNPTDKDILKIRKEAEEAVVRMGAHPDSVEVQVEIDPQKNLVRAVATGSTELRTRDLSREALLMKDLEQAVRKSVRGEIIDFACIGEAGGLHIFRVETEQKRLMGLLKKREAQYRIIDSEGIIRLQIARGEGMIRTKRDMEGGALRDFIERHTQYGDAGRSLPGFFILFRGRILDLSGLLSASHIVSLAGVELARLGDDESVAALVNIV
jgi:N-methylhydantoinase A/oxoprolinase/acetone carboxylase beta subunit